MNYCETVLDTIGNTPLIKLNKLVDDRMATVFGKAEFLNPSGSLKDRMAVHILDKAEKAGLVKPGATIVEATAGNTGLSFAMAAAVRGYRCIFTVPDKFSSEKINMLKALNAEVIITPTSVPDEHPDSWTSVATKVAEETPNTFYVNQFFQPDNVEAHYLTTGPEIWEQTDGKIDYFVSGAGSGGVTSGVAKYLKEQAAKSGREVKIVCPDPLGSAYFDAFYGNKDGVKRSYKVEGMGNDFKPGTLDFTHVDEMMQISDRESFFTARRLAREEGLFVGGTAGTNVCAALKIASEAGPGKIVVTVLCDSGARYISKFYSDDWMKDFGYIDLDYKLGTVRDLLQFNNRKVEFARADETITEVVERMRKNRVSQMPIPSEAGLPAMMVHESDILKSLLSRSCSPEDAVVKAASPLHGVVSLDEPVSSLEAVFTANNVAVAVEGEEIVGIATRIDLVQYLAGRKT